MTNRVAATAGWWVPLVVLALAGSTVAVVSGESEGGVEVAGPATPGPATGASAARRIARAEYPGATITDVDLGREAGRLVWDVDLANSRGEKRELDVSAGRGG